MGREYDKSIYFFLQSQNRCASERTSGDTDASCESTVVTAASSGVNSTII